MYTVTVKVGDEVRVCKNFLRRVNAMKFVFDLEKVITPEGGSKVKIDVWHKGKTRYGVVKA